MYTKSWRRLFIRRQAPKLRRKSILLVKQRSLVLAMERVQKNSKRNLKALVWAFRNKRLRTLLLSNVGPVH
jgi:hypothetical protein